MPGHIVTRSGHQATRPDLLQQPWLAPPQQARKPEQGAAVAVQATLPTQHPASTPAVTGTRQPGQAEMPLRSAEPREPDATPGEGGKRVQQEGEGRGGERGAGRVLPGGAGARPEALQGTEALLPGEADACVPRSAPKGRGAGVTSTRSVGKQSGHSAG